MFLLNTWDILWPIFMGGGNRRNWYWYILVILSSFRLKWHISWPIQDFKNYWLKCLIEEKKGGYIRIEREREINILIGERKNDRAY